MHLHDWKGHPLRCSHCGVRYWDAQRPVYCEPRKPPQRGWIDRLISFFRCDR